MIPPTLHPRQIDAIMAGYTSTQLPYRMGTGTGKNAVQAYLSKMIWDDDNNAKILLLHPNSCLEQTYEELQVWLGDDFVSENVQLLRADAIPSIGYKGMSIAQRAKAIKESRKSIYLLGHEALSFNPIKHAFKTIEWTAAFLDEASRFRKWSSRTRTILGLRSARRYALSGSFVTKSPDDLWYPFRYLDKRYFPYSHTIFRREWCEMGGWQGTSPIATREGKTKQLAEFLDTVCFTLNLSEMRDDMPNRPPAFHRPLSMSGKQAVAYHEFADTLRLEIERENESTFQMSVNAYVTRIQRLQEIAAGFSRNTDGDIINLPSPKTEECVELIYDNPVPTIVWCWWQPEMDHVTIRLRESGLRVSHGREDKQWRRDFLDGRTDVAVLQIASGGYGLNLDRADQMIYHSLPWSLDNYMQSQERNWRFTTTRDRTVIHLTCAPVDLYVRSRLLTNAATARPLTRADALSILRG